MAYLVLARKYRPQTFEEIYAQDHITKILKNTIELDRTAHAYLFTGPRGVGKTSLARIYAKSLNCLNNGPTTTPCNECQNCIEITQGISADVIEIDGASNTGVEDIRDLQRELMYSPSNSRYKIYIIDEVHMLSKNAFNALLKTLEEPPESIIFIFATTEPHKVLPTIISRCQRFDFNRIPIPAIIDRLKSICEIEKISIDDDALFMIAKKADGSMRDAQSLMDQVLAYGKEHTTLDDVLSIFGIVHTDVYNQILHCIVDKDASKIIHLLHDILEKGNDIQEFLNGILDYIRNILLLKVEIDIPVMSDTDKKVMMDIGSKFQENDLLYLMSLLIKTKTDIKSSNNPILVAEMSFVKLTKLSELRSLDKILETIYKGETQVAEEPEKISPPQPEVDIQSKTEEAKTILEKEVQEKKPKIEELTEQIIEENIKNIVQKLKKEKPIIGNYFEKSKLENVSNNIVHYTVANSLSHKMLEDNKAIISGIFSNHFNLKIRVEFTLHKVEKEKVITNPTLEDIKRESPGLADFIEKTDSIIS